MADSFNINPSPKEMKRRDTVLANSFAERFLAEIRICSIPLRNG